MRIHVLGGFRVEIDGIPVERDVWQRRISPRLLIKLLAIEPTHRIHREQVLERLWPEASIDSGMRRFSKALYAARRAISGPEAGARRYVHFANDIVAIDGDEVWFDVDHFEALARRALTTGAETAVLEALTAYGGELLPEDRYEDWAAARREEIEALHGDLLGKLAGLYEQQGRFADAIPIWQQLVTKNPTFEPGHQALMRLYAATGSRTRALQQYEKLRTLLQDELAAVPEPESESLYRDLLAGRLSQAVEPPAIPRGTIPPTISRLTADALVGRDRIMDILRQDMAEASQGLGRIVVIEGEIGIGKTRLLAELAVEARDAGFTPIWGGATSPEVVVPYGQFVNALEAHLVDYPLGQLDNTARRYPALSEIVPSLAGRAGTPDHELSPQTRQSQIVAGIQGFLAQLSTQAPLVLILDDFHHADAASVHMLYELAKAAPTHPWLICLTVRTEGVRSASAVGALLPVLRQESLARYIELNRLSPDATAAIVQGLLQSTTGEKLQRRVYDLSLGNPLIAREVTLDMREQGHIVQSDAGWEAGGDGGEHSPLPIREILLGRLHRLGPEARNIVDVAAILGFAFTLSELREAVGIAFPSQTAEDLLVALDTTLEHHFLTSQGDVYSFSHPMVHLALIDDMVEHRRSHFHGAVARALEEINPSDVDRLAYHYARSFEKNKAIEFLERAAQRAAGLYANVEAADYYVELLRHLDEPANALRAARARRRLGLALTRTGRYDDALRELRQAREGFASVDAYDDMAYTTALMGDAYFNGGAPGEGEATVAAFMGDYGDRVSAVPQAALQAVLALLYFPLGRPEGELAAAQEAERLAGSRVDDPIAHHLLGTALTEHGAALMALGRTDEAAPYLAQGLQIAERVGDIYGVGRAATALSRLAELAGNFDEEEAQLRKALEAAETLGNPSRTVFTVARLSRRATLVGNLVEAREYAERARGIDAKNPSSSRTIVYLALAELAAAMGDDAAVQSLAEEGKSQAEVLQDVWLAAELEALDLEFRLLHRNPEGVPERLSVLLGGAHLRPAYFRRLLAQAYFQLRRMDEAATEIAAAEEHARRVNDRLDLPLILGVKAVLRAAEGRLDEAEAIFDDALALTQELGLPRHEAMLLRARGTTARRKGLPGRARENLLAAQEIFSRLGAEGVARLIHDELAAIPDHT